MATTTNYGWGTPDDTDLVKDGALAIRDLGQDIDTTTKALNPETTTGDIAYRSATANTNTRLALGTAGQILTVNSGATAPEWATPAAPTGSTIAIFADHKNNAAGGTFTSGAYRTRDLNTTIFNNISGASLSSNQITLPAGTYQINAQAPAFLVNNHQTRLLNTTDSTEITGGVSYAGSGDNVTNLSIVNAAFTIAASKVFELQHKCTSTASTQGFGANYGSNNPDVYSQITIVKVG
jgi:hypothetical protein